jgi:hypothetical protein
MLIQVACTSYLTAFSKNDAAFYFDAISDHKILQTTFSLRGFGMRLEEGN